MKREQSRFKFFIIAIIFISFSFIALTASFAEQRRLDQTISELDIANRLETMLETIIGKGRSLVKVSLRLSQDVQNKGFETKYLKGVPGVVYSENKPENLNAQGENNPTYPSIQNISIIIYLDNKLSQDKIETVKKSVTQLMGLDFNSGDSLKIEPVPLNTIMPGASAVTGEETAPKQTGLFLKRNLWLFAVIAIIAVFGFILLFIIVGKRFIKSGANIKPEEAKKTPDLEDLLQDLKKGFSQLSSAPPENISGILEDIKEILARPPARTDGLLEEIKNNLDKISQVQTMTGTGPAAPTGGGGGPAGASPGMANPEFINALKEAIFPAVSSAASGPGLSPEVVNSLQKIEELMRTQIQTTGTDTKALSEPFKYLDSLTPREISLFIEGETPRIAAIILGHVNPNKTGMVLSSLPEDKQIEIAIAMASLVENQETAVEIKDFIQRKMPTVKLRADFSPIVGTKALADILSSISYNVTNSILTNIEKKDPAIAASVKNDMFLFDDIANLDNKTMQEIFKSVDRDRLALALSRASDKIRQRFYDNTTENSATILKEDIEALQPATKEGESPKKITLFEDIVDLDNKTAQNMFKITDKDTLKVALKGTSDEIRQKMYSLMTERAAAMLKEDIDVMNPVTHRRAEEAQKKILDEIHNLEKKPFIAQQEIIEKILELEKAGRISIRKNA